MEVAMFIHGESYEKYQVFAAYQAGIKTFTPFKSRLAKTTFRLHNANPLNRKHELPFKFLWYNRVLKGINFSIDDEIIFLLYESFNFSYSRHFLSYLKKKYPRSRNCFVFTNPPDSYNTARVEYVRELYDYVVSDVKSLAEKYGYIYYPFNPMKFPEIGDNCPKNDVFFVGADKGRLSMLLAFFELMNSFGLKCDFNIVGVPKEKQKYADIISYNNPLSYDEVLNRINSSRCVLEIVQKNLNYYTFRVSEAMLLHKKLISTNVELKNDSIFNSRILKTFSPDEPLQSDFISFIKQSADIKDYPDSSNWSFSRFIDFLQSSPSNC